MLRVAVVFEHKSQERVAECLEAQLPLELFSVRQLAVAGENDVTRLACSRHMSWPDIVILTIGEWETTAFIAAFRRMAAATDLPPRPLFVSMNIGLALDRAFPRGFSFRRASDVVLVNRQSDVGRLQDFLRELGGAPGEIRACLCPIFSRGHAFLDPAEREAIRRRPVRSLLFAVQTDIPSSRRERTYMAQRLVDYAKAHPDRRVIIKPCHQLHEKTDHPQRSAYEHIFRRLLERTGVENVIFSYTSVPDLLSQVDLLVSISSIAIVEALSWGNRAVSILDLGVRQNLGNPYFLGSDLLTTIEALIADDIPLPSTKWLSAELGAPDIAAVLIDLEPLARKAKAGMLPFAPMLFLDRCSEALPAIAPGLTENEDASHPSFLSIPEVAALIKTHVGRVLCNTPQQQRLLDKATACLDVRDWWGALDVSTSALSQTPASTKHLRVAAEAVRRLGHLDEAVRFLKRARRLRPQDRRLRSEHRSLKRRSWLRRVLGRS
jgi:hypothetical protein